MGSTLRAKFACKFRMIKMSLPVPFSEKELGSNTPSFIDAQASIFTVVRMRAIRQIANGTLRIKGRLFNIFITVPMSTTTILFIL